MYLHKNLRSALSADKLTFSNYILPPRAYEFTSITALKSQLNNLSYIHPLWYTHNGDNLPNNDYGQSIHPPVLFLLSRISASQIVLYLEQSLS
jgi:hypothetical protein